MNVSRPGWPRPRVEVAFQRSAAGSGDAAD
jgi:hypothetical protein